MSNLSDQTRADSSKRLREAADLLDRGDELAAGKMILEGLKPVALELKRTYGPMVKLLVNGWIRGVLG